MKRFLSDVCNLLIGGLTVALSLIIGFIYWMFDAEALIPLWSIVILSLVFYIASLVLYSVFKRPKEEMFRLPMVKKIHKTNDNIILILEKSELYNINSLVSIYYEESIQEYLGYGYVETINSSGYPQIKFSKIEDSQIERMKNFTDTAKNRSSIKVKPTVSMDVLGGE